MPTTIDRALSPDTAEEMTAGERLTAVETVVGACASYLGWQVNHEVWGKGSPVERVARVQAALKDLLARATSGAYVLNERLLDNLERSTVTLATITEELRKGCAKPAKPQQLVKRMASDVPPVVNTSAMSATFTISTEAEDRDGDVIIQKGIKLDKYRLNPVVLYQHGSVLDFPIGSSRSPAGKLSVVRDGNTTQATCYFSKSLAARQVYELVAEGVLSGASINVIPTRSQPRRGGRYLIDESEMLEWSIVDIPANGEAVRKALSQNWLAGRSIEPSLAKSLRLSQVRLLLAERHALVKEFGATLLQLKGNR